MVALHFLKSKWISKKTIKVSLYRQPRSLSTKRRCSILALRCRVIEWCLQSVVIEGTLWFGPRSLRHNDPLRWSWPIYVALCSYESLRPRLTIPVVSPHNIFPTVEQGILWCLRASFHIHGLNLFAQGPGNAGYSAKHRALDVRTRAHRVWL